MELTPEQVRVLGCLLEKEATTPDQYPLSTNALTLACNQKSNRDPIVSYSERDVDQVVRSLRELGLARTVHAAAARVPKHRHVLDEAWGLDERQLAVLAVLFLRGPNTVNELLLRTDRYGHFGDPDAVRACLRSLEERDPALVLELERQPGQREVRFTHLALGEPVVGTFARPARGAPAVEGTDQPPPTPPGRTDPLAAEVAELRAELAELRTEVAELRTELAELRTLFD